MKPPAERKTFSSLLRSARPERVASDRPGDGLERVLHRHRVRVRSRRRKAAAVGAFFLVLIPVLIQTDVVSSVLELIELDGPDWVGRIFKFSDDSVRFNVLGEHTDEEILEYGQMILADEGVVVSAHGFTLKGNSSWFVTRSYQALGGETESSSRAGSPASELTEDYRKFIFEDWEGYLVRIESGKLEPVGVEVVTLDGRSFRMEIWELDHPEFGIIKYYEGDVLPEEKPEQE